MSNKNMYRVYGKFNDMKRFKAFDMDNNKFVGNLINASVFYESELSKLKKEIAFMNENNDNYQFEIRQV